MPPAYQSGWAEFDQHPVNRPSFGTFAWSSAAHWKTLTENRYITRTHLTRIRHLHSGIVWWQSIFFCCDSNEAGVLDGVCIVLKRSSFGKCRTVGDFEMALPTGSRETRCIHLKVRTFSSVRPTVGNILTSLLQSAKRLNHRNVLELK